jgi:hypothetical protein
MDMEDKKAFHQTLNNKNDVLKIIETHIETSGDMNNTDGIVWHAIMNTIEGNLDQIIGSVRAYIDWDDD